METQVAIKSLSRAEVYGLDNRFKGTILIPDISGFTKFVNETEFAVGREIIRQLLQVIIHSNSLNLKISEIEGDAILFYTMHPLTPIQIKGQYEVMLAGFREKTDELSLINGFEIDLSLKMIAHYGELSTYLIGGFEKLYGKAIIEAHALLKNSIRSKSYFLLTDSVLDANKEKFVGTCFYAGSQLCDFYGDLKKISYFYLDYEDVGKKGNIRLAGGEPNNKNGTKINVLKRLTV